MAQNKSKKLPRKIMITIFNELAQNYETYIIEFSKLYHIVEAIMFEELEIRKDETMKITETTLQVKKLEKISVNKPN